VREGDTVVVWKLDRLGRNLQHILATVKALTDRGVTLVSVTDGIDSSTPAGRMMIGVLGSLSSTSGRSPSSEPYCSGKHLVLPAQIWAAQEGRRR
jgi:DNA invertase Pin-like site-specific DNA recombinase